MSHPNDIKASGSGAADNAILFTSEEVSKCNEHVLRVTAGTVDVEVSIDEGVNFTDSATFPVSLMLLNATSPGTWVTEVTAGQAAVLTGRFDHVRVREKGATPAAAHMSSYVR